jgi:nitrate/TMAO reductase-like tetraheme cytochrome c subunit
MVVSLDIVPELMGRLDTQAKYEAHRGEMAKSVWTQYRENDSEFCRHCHNPERMDVDQQERRAGRNHSKAATNGATCIDCHQGIVHALPEGWTDIWAEVQAVTKDER